MKRIFAFIGFSLALTLIALNILSFRYSILILAIAVVLFIASLLPKELRQAGVLPVIFGSMIFACLIFITCVHSAVLPAKSLDGKTADVELKITDMPKYNVQNDYYTYQAIVISTDIPGSISDFNIKLKTKEAIDADYYDTVYANVSFYNITDNPFESYGQYGDRIFINARLNRMDGFIINSSKPLKYNILSIRQSIFDTLNSQLKGDKAGLSIALLTGDRSYLSSELSNQFRLCGLSHFLAVSGFHISIICMSFYYILKRLRVPNIINTVLSLTIIFVYCGIANFSMSCVRASIMVCIMIVSNLFNKKADPLNSLGFAVSVMCINPFSVTDAGAVLTVCAMLGILMVYEPIRKNFEYKNKISEYFDNTSLFTLCILAAVTPALYVFYGSVSLGSLFLNIIIEPLIVVIMFSAIIFVFVSSLPILSFLPRGIINTVTEILEEIISFASVNLSSMNINISSQIFGISIASIFIFIGIMILIFKRVPIKSVLIYVVTVAIIASSLSFYQISKYSTVYISSSSMVVAYDNKDAVVIGMNDNYDAENARLLTKNRNVVYIDSKFAPEEMNLSEEYSFISDNIALNKVDEIISLNICDKHFKITNDYVIIDEKYYSRDGYYTDYTSCCLTFAENTEIKVRRDYSG